MNEPMVQSLIDHGFQLVTVLLLALIAELFRRYHKAVNSQFSAFLKLTGESERAKGVKQGEDHPRPPTHTGAQ